MIDDDRLPKKQLYVLYLEDVPKHKWACKAVGISDDTSKRWRDEDPDFADACEIALSSWVRRNVKKSSPEFQLERLLAEDFKERKDITSGDKPFALGEIDVPKNISIPEDKQTD
jgi:hypothetical protein